MTAPVTAPPGGPAVRSPRREIPRQAEDYTAAAAQQVPVPAVRLHHRRRGRAEPDRQRHAAGLRLDPGVAATVLCGEVSLGAAVVADEWVTAHERLGRNRP
jgi:hypothetical protein